MLNPIPGLDDILLFPVFSSALGWELTIDGIKANFLPYTIITAGIGIGIAWSGLYVTGLKPKYLINKIKRLIKI